MHYGGVFHMYLAHSGHLYIGISFALVWIFIETTKLIKTWNGTDISLKINFQHRLNNKINAKTLYE